MADAAANLFDRTLRQYEAAYTVEMISTFSLVECEDPAQASSLFASNPDVDQIPVRRDGAICSVMERPHPAHEVAIREGMLVGSEESLLTFIPSLKERRYFLVLRQRQICGIVTRSDLVKLPVRILAFTLVSHLESLMTDFISERYESVEFLDALTDGRRAKFDERLADLRARKIDPAPVEVLLLADKRDVIASLGRFERRFDDDLHEIEKLRNDVAHAVTYANDHEAVVRFLQRLELAEHWIEQISQAMREGQAVGL
jgi:hypothetical protein